MWQALFDELRALGLVVVAVALDGPDAARPWIEAARATYPCLIDRDHWFADLYGLVNVPQAVWIDEHGTIVRPPESAGATDGFRAMDRSAFTMPDAVLAERERVRRAYYDALRDWVSNGAASRFALDAARAGARLPAPSPAIADAHARFRLGRHLLRLGREDEASALFAQAAQLHPDSWAIWRQSAAKDARGFASGPAFWARVDALGERAYYPPAQL